MKKILSLIIAAVASIGLFAQNGSADSILGTYTSTQNGDQYKVVVSKAADGTYTGKIVWALLTDGKPFGLPSGVPVTLSGNDQLVLFSGLSYNASKQRWDGTKIYDPQRNIRANMQASFTDPSTLKIRGSLLGISENVFWKKQ